MKKALKIVAAACVALLLIWLLGDLMMVLFGSRVIPKP